GIRGFHVTGVQTCALPIFFIPVVNLLMFPVVWVETIRSFGKNKTLDTWLVLLTLGLYIYYLNYVEADKLTYIQDRSLKPTNAVRSEERRVGKEERPGGWPR